MKKLLLFFAVALLVGCAKDHTEDINAINNRLDVLEQTTLPSIEEQIETINLAIDQLKEVDTALRKEIESLKSSAQDASNKIAALEDANKAIETKITELQEYVDSEIKKAKDDAAAAYATCDELKSAKTELTNLKSSVVDLESSLTTKINDAVSVLDSKIADLEARLKAVEDKVESLLARIQSVSYIPEYADGKVLISRFGATSSGELSFRISPKDAVVELEKVWSTALSCEAFYPKTRAVSLVKLAVTEYVADAESGVITVKISGEGLSDEFFAGTQEAKVALVISDGNNQIVSDYADMVGKEIVDEIWYTTIDEQPLAPNKEGVDIFGANIVSNTYENGKGVIKFDGPVTKIGQYAFGVNGSSTAVSTLKEIILPNGVTSIAGWAFSYCCDNLVSVVMPDSVTEIGRTAFAENEKLEYVRMSKNLDTMGTYAFSKCISLKSIEIPETLTAIPAYAFRYCNSLTSIAFHNKIISCGTDAFLSCSKLERVDITDLSAWCNIDFANWDAQPMSCAKHLYLNGEEIIDLVIPADVTNIKSRAFICPNIKSVTMHNNVTTIGDFAFSKLIIESITIPDSAISFGFNILHDCDNLSQINGKLATADKRCLVVDGILNSFAPAGLTTYTIPEDVTEIGSNAMYGCTIKGLTIHAGVKTLVNRSLYANSIRSVRFLGSTPPTITGKEVFHNNDASILVPADAVDNYKSAPEWSTYAERIRPFDENMNVITYTSTDGKTVNPYSGELNDYRTIESLFAAKMISNTYENGVGKMVFDGVVSIIGDSAFYYCRTLKSIVIPNGVIALGGDAFDECRNLEDITLNDGLKIIYKDAFHFCDSLKSLTIPDSVYRIDETAFFNCGLDFIYSKFSTSDHQSVIVDNKLIWVSCSYPAGKYIIPNGVTHIGSYAFGYPKEVISITIPESVESFSSHPFIGVNKISAFYGKYTTADNRAVIKDDVLYGVATNGITKYTVPEGVKSITYRMFRECGLEEITLPESLEKAGDNQFEDARTLKTIYCKAIVPPAADDDLFLDATNISKIYVPSQSVEAYKAAAGWSTKADKIIGNDF